MSRNSKTKRAVNWFCCGTDKNVTESAKFQYCRKKKASIARTLGHRAAKLS